MSDTVKKINEELRDKEKDSLTHIVAIFDMSGSMYSLKDDVIGSFNSFIEKQKEDDTPAIVSLVLFDNIIEEPFTKKSIIDVEPIDNTIYSPRGATALYDAIGQTIARFKDDKNVIMIIQTDGYENSSKEYKKDDIKSLVQKKTEDGWDINFLAADIDTVAVSSSLGIVASKSVAFDKTSAGLTAGYDAMSNVTMSYRNSVKEKADLTCLKNIED